MKKNILSLFFSIIISLLVIEGILRVFHIGGKRIPVPQWYLIATDYGYDINPNFYPPKYAFVEGAYKYKVWSNSLGCFDIEHNLNSSDSKVLFLGDSFTWGYTAYNKKYTTIFERFTQIESLKCGVLGYGVKQAFKKAVKIIPKVSNLSLIVYSYYLNDLDDDFLYPAKTVIGGWPVNKCIYSNIFAGRKYCYRYSELLQQYTNFLTFCTSNNPQKPVLQRLKCFLARNLYLYNILTKSLKQLLPTFMLNQIQFEYSNKTFDRSYPYAIFGLYHYPWVKKELNNEISLLKNLESFKKLLVLIFPVKEQVYPYLLKDNKYVRATYAYTRVYYKLCVKKNMIDYKCLYRPQMVLRKLLERKKIAYIDFLPIMKYYVEKSKNKSFLDERDFYWSLDGHFNERGNLLVGLVLAKVIVESDLIKISFPNKKIILNKIDMEIKKFFGKRIPQKILNSAIYIPKEGK